MDLRETLIDIARTGMPRPQEADLSLEVARWRDRWQAASEALGHAQLEVLAARSEARALKSAFDTSVALQARLRAALERIGANGMQWHPSSVLWNMAREALAEVRR